MKTLLQINTVVNSGATGRIAEEIGEVAMANGWDSYIAYGRNKRTSNSKLIKIGTDWDINFHVLQTRLFDRHGLASVEATKKLILEIQKVKPTVIHLLNLHGYYINIELLFRFLQTSDIPVIWTILDCWPFTGHCTYFDAVGCNKWKTECFNCPSKKEYPSSWLMDNSKLNYRIKKDLFTSLANITLITHSEWLKKLIKQSFLKDIPVNMIHNGVNINKFTYSDNRNFINKNNLGKYKFILGVANNWIKRKGLADFITLSKFINSDTRILLVGLGSTEVKDLPENVIAIPRTESVEELAELYSSVDVFVNPTWEDNFPTTNLEALACGVPVITYNTGGSPEAINSKTGIIVEKGDIQGLSNAVKQIQSNGKNFYHRACIERARTWFNKDEKFQEYVELFNTKILPAPVNLHQ